MKDTRYFLCRLLACCAAMALIQPPAGVAADAAKPLVDRYGQSTRAQWPGKVTDDKELKADAARQVEAPDNGPALDPYGGLAGSGEKYGLARTGFFHVGKAGDRQVLVTPDGNIFFHLAVCGISLTDDYTLVRGREQTYEWLPETNGDFASAWRPGTPGVVSFYVANQIRKYGKPFSLEEWSGRVVDRLRAWGFNSAGAFSEFTGTMRERNFPYVSWLPSGEEYGAKTLPDKLGAAKVIDPYWPGTEEALDKAFSKRIAASANDPLIIGYFNSNEQHLELISQVVPRYKASEVAAKRKLVDDLRRKYGSVEAFNAAWQPERPFATFDEAGEAPLRVTTEAAAADMNAFFRDYLETYFSMVERTFRKYDRNHLLIGSRLTPATANNRDIVEISGAHTDVVSVNYYTYAIDRAFLERVHRWSGGKPVILSEWYFSATNTGLGSGKEVKNQEERGLAYRHYVEQTASLPFVVGSEWFIYTDQALTGRFFEGFHGEGNNTGLVSVTDRPYEELVAATHETGEGIYDVMMGKKKAFVFNDPRFLGGDGAQKVVSVPKALPEMKFDGSTTGWPGRPAEPLDGSRILHGNPNPALRGDFRLCWDRENLYFLIQVKDPTPAMNDKPAAALWMGDAVELFLGAKNVDQGGARLYSDVQVLFGAGREPRVYIENRPEDAALCRVLARRDVAGDGYVLEAAIPWKVLKAEPSAGTSLLFDVAVDNSDDGQVRKQQIMWNGGPIDRGSWGLARLVEN